MIGKWVKQVQRKWPIAGEGGVTDGDARSSARTYETWRIRARLQADRGKFINEAVVGLQLKPACCVLRQQRGMCVQTHEIAPAGFTLKSVTGARSRAPAPVQMI